MSCSFSFLLIVFNTDNFLSKEFSTIFSNVDRNPGNKKVQGKATTLARRRFQTTFKKFYRQSTNYLSQSVSPKDSAVTDDSDAFDPRAVAVIPSRAKSSVRPTRANSSEDFVSPKPKKSKKQPAKGQKKVSDFFSKASPPSPEATPDPESPNTGEDEADVDVFTDQLSMAHIGKNLSTFIGACL